PRKGSLHPEPRGPGPRRRGDGGGLPARRSPARATPCCRVPGEAMSRRSRSDDSGFSLDPQVGENSVPTATEGATDEAPPAATPELPATEEVAPPKRYVVAPGRSLTVRRGHLSEGAPVRPTDLSAEQ